MVHPSRLKNWHKLRIPEREQTEFKTEDSTNPEKRVFRGGQGLNEGRQQAADGMP